MVSQHSTVHVVTFFLSLSDQAITPPDRATGHLSFKKKMPVRHDIATEGSAVVAMCACKSNFQIWADQTVSAFVRMKRIWHGYGIGMKRQMIMDSSFEGERQLFARSGIHVERV